MDTHVKTEEKNISEMGANFSNVGDQTQPAALPDDLIFDILLRVPATDIYYAARLVCRKWYQITRTHDFVHAHLQQSTCGLLIQPTDWQSNKQLLFVTQKGRIIEKSNFIYKFKGAVFNSCNGLMLESRCMNGKDLRITNPATKKHLDIFPPDDLAFYTWISIAYAVASAEYKVVCVFLSNARRRECAILTAGVDENWKRRVDIQHLSTGSKKLLTERPLTTQGFVHWAAQHGSSRYPEYVVTLNIETEIITQFPAVPPNIRSRDGETELYYSYLPMGRCLSLLIARADGFPILDQVWEMEPETGEWTKVMSIDSESQKRAFEGLSDLNLYPVGWLKCQEVLLFVSPSSSSCIAYNVRTHEIESSFQLGFSPHRFIVHRNSLVWLE